MKVLFIDLFSSFLDLAQRCVEAGHEVRWFQGKLKDGTPSPVGRGLIPRIPAWESSMRWADLIVLSDNARWLPALESYRRRGFPIFGPNLDVAQWELDRECGQQVFEAHGIETAPRETFRSIREARACLMQRPGRYVSKPNADEDKSLSYVSKSARDMMFMLDKWEKAGKIKTSFTFQKFVPGIEFAVGGWMGRDGFIGPWLENFEHKKLMNDEIGPNTGEMGTVLKYVRESLLADLLLRPVEAELIRQGYTGYIDAAAIIREDGTPMPLEWTARPGWPLTQILQCLHKGDPVEWMADALMGRDTLDVTNEVAAGVVLALPDFPYSRLPREAVSGFPVYGAQRIPKRHFHPAEMMAGPVWDMDKGRLYQRTGLVTAGDYVCIVTGAGKTVSVAREQAYKHVDMLEMPNSPLYRTDIGCRVERKLPELRALGYCAGWPA